MPIANCIISPELTATLEQPQSLIELWSGHSGQSSEHMTVNLISSIAQVGAGYKIMAFLYLPSLWSDKAVSQLQIGLARSLAEGFACDLSSVQIITTMVNSGFVVENGEQIEW